MTYDYYKQTSAECKHVLGKIMCNVIFWKFNNDTMALLLKLDLDMM